MSEPKEKWEVEKLTDCYYGLKAPDGKTVAQVWGRANSEYLASAINNHSRLVEALDGLIIAFDKCKTIEDYNLWKQKFEQAKKLLAEVK